MCWSVINWKPEENSAGLRHSYSIYTVVFSLVCCPENSGNLGFLSSGNLLGTSCFSSPCSMAWKFKIVSWGTFSLTLLGFCLSKIIVLCCLMSSVLKTFFFLFFYLFFFCDCRKEGKFGLLYSCFDQTRVIFNAFFFQFTWHLNVSHWPFGN